MAYGAPDEFVRWLPPNPGRSTRSSSWISQYTRGWGIGNGDKTTGKKKLGGGGTRRKEEKGTPLISSNDAWYQIPERRHISVNAGGGRWMTSDSLWTMVLYKSVYLLT